MKKIKKILVLIGLGLCFIMILPLAIKEKMEEPEPVTVTIPERKGIVIDTIEKIITKEVIVDNNQVIIDSTYYDLYVKAKDSVKKLNLYINAIKIREYNKTIVDNDTIKIDGYFKTRGSLLDYRMDYTIKPFEYTYTPEVIYKKPRLSASIGFELGLPVDNHFVFKPVIDIENRLGTVSFSYDSDRRFWFGLKKNFKILN